MRQRQVAAVIAVLVLSGWATAVAADTKQRGDTKADFTPFRSFEPVARSSPCTGEAGGATAQPFVLPLGFSQQVVAQEGDGASTDLWDMNTQNESGKDAGRYVYRTHEVGAGSVGGGGGSQVTVTDLTSGVTKVLAQRSDWERFDGIVWTPWGTLLAAEETRAQTGKDPDVPQAVGGLVYELFVDPSQPDALLPGREPISVGDATADMVQDGVRARPALGAKSHEGLRFDARGFLYGISESTGSAANLSGAIFKFVPHAAARDETTLAFGRLQAFESPNGHDGAGTWIDLDPTASQVDADKEAETKGVNEYERPEDIETGESTGVDVHNRGQTLYVAITGTDEVLAIDVSSASAPFAYHYVSTGPHLGAANAPSNAPPGEFDSPDNLALDRKGNLAITEDPGGNPPSFGGTKTQGDDIWVAAAPGRSNNLGGDDQQPATGGSAPRSARSVSRLATIKDCVAEPTGVYFAMKGTRRFVKGTAMEGLVADDTLFVNRQHAGQISTVDQLVAITPLGDVGD